MADKGRVGIECLPFVETCIRGSIYKDGQEDRDVGKGEDDIKR